MTITEALKSAKAAHSPLLRAGGRWIFTRPEGMWSVRQDPAPYQAARLDRARSIALHALVALGHDADHAAGWVYDSWGTSAEMVARYLDRWDTPEGRMVRDYLQAADAATAGDR